MAESGEDRVSFPEGGLDPFTAPDPPAGALEPGGPPPGPPARRRRGLVAAITAALVLLASGVGIGWGLTRAGGGSSAGPIRTLPHIAVGSGRNDTGLDAAAIAKKIEPAVVDINTYTTAFAGNPFGPGATARPLGAGTGMILSSSGEVLTNNHVVDGATSIRVTIEGHSGTYAANVIGVDPTDDVALIRIKGVSGLPTVRFADTSGLTVGEEVLAIGNALGQGGTPTVTVGTITALHRAITVGDDQGGSEHLHGLIQTDASVSPGDSGGPLVDSSGDVVGMITASARNHVEQRGSHVAFAIASDTAVGVVDRILSGRGGPSIIIGQPGFLGVQVRNLDAQTAARLGLPVTTGALIEAVVPGTPAAAAGIPRLAAITAVDGQAIASADALGPALHRHKPGDQVRITWVDRTGTHTVTVSLIQGPAV